MVGIEHENAHSGPSVRSWASCLDASLGLAAPGSTTVGCSAGRSTCGSTIRQDVGGTGGGETPASLTNRRDGLVLHLNQGAGSPTAALGDGLLVCSQIETDEEEEVRGDDDHA